MRSILLLVLLAIPACGDPDDTGPEDEGLDPAGDEDGDGYSNAEEEQAGSDPFDPADVPYLGGWAKGACRDGIEASGNEVGQVAQDFSLLDQYGEPLRLHDFCDRVVLLEFAGFT